MCRAALLRPGLSIPRPLTSKELALSPGPASQVAIAGLVPRGLFLLISENNGEEEEEGEGMGEGKGERESEREYQ